MNKLAEILASLIKFIGVAGFFFSGVKSMSEILKFLSRGESGVRSYIQRVGPLGTKFRDDRGEFDHSIEVSDFFLFGWG